MDEDRYEITSLLGKGRTGGVYAARDHQLNRGVAIRRFLSKVELSEQDAYSADFLKVSHQIRALKHTGLLDVLEADIDEDGPYLVTDHIENSQRLSEWITNKPLDEDGAIDLAKQLLSAFKAAHHENIFHGALTAGSILMMPQSNGKPHFMVMDMGLAQLASLALGHQPAYAKMADAALLAPEIFDDAPAAESSDCYMLGQLIYLSLLGGHPFALQDISEVEKSHKNGLLPPLTNYRTDISKALTEWIEWLVQPDPNKRPQTTEEALAALPKPTSERQVFLTPAPTTSPLKVETPRSVADAVIKATHPPLLSKKTAFEPTAPKSKKKLTLAICVPLAAIVASAVAFSPSDAPAVDNYYDESASTPSVASSESIEPVLLFEDHIPRRPVKIGAGHPTSWGDVNHANTLDWVVFRASPEKWDSSSRSKSKVIKGVSPIGDLQDSPVDVGNLVFYNQKKKNLKPNLYGKCAQVGNGWEIELKVPANAQSIDLYLTSWNCDAELKIVDADGASLSEVISFHGDSENTSFASTLPLVIQSGAEPQTIYLELTSLDEKSGKKGHGISLNAVIVK